MSRAPAVLTAAVVSVIIAACGGGGSSSGSSGSTPPPATPPANPCTTALTADTADFAAAGSAAQAGTPPPDKRTLVDGNPRGRVYEAIALHRAAGERGQRASAASPAPVADDTGDIAVLQDTGDLVLSTNLFDLGNAGLRFTRSGSSYTSSKIDGTFRTSLGGRVTLSDDDSAQVAIPFPFPFYGTAQTTAFVNSDGNITFVEGDKASTERNIARVLTGPPRVAPFFSDLDPTTGTGRIFVNAAPDQFTVTWCSVRGFDSVRTTTTQATLLPDGSVEIKFGGVTLTDAIVGISPGHTGDFAAVDLDTSGGSGSGAIGERFAGSNSIDTVAVAKKFYATHPDTFDQLLLWTDQPLISGAFAYEVTVANEVRGLGQDIYDLSQSFGSAGRLRSLVVMDWLGKYPDDPAQKLLGENNTLSVMGQEAGHRWLAYLEFRDRTGARSQELLGRDNAHWSFFFNSDASVMEGNAIQDLGGGQFRTVDAVTRYSRLDQYAMGLVPPSGVPPFFYVENPGSSHTKNDAPAIGVSFTGTRRDVLIDDVVAIEGPRTPVAAASPRTHRQAFIYVVSNGRSTDTAQVAKLDRIRTQWETFFLQATEGRMTAVTKLR
jgi:hypothetical protein